MRPQPAPRGYSIVQRLTVLVVVISTLALILNAALFAQAIEPMGDNLVDSYAQQLLSLRRALAEVPLAARPGLAQVLSRRELQLQRGDSDALPAAHVAVDPLSTLLAERLERALPGQAVVSRPPMPEELEPQVAPYLLMSFMLDGQRWDLRLAVRRPPMFWPLLPSLVMLGLVGLAALLMAITGIRILTRPMAHISQRMAERHQALRPIDLTPAMGRELQHIVQSFNGLVQALAAGQATRRHMLAGLSHDLRTPLARLQLRVDCECTPETVEVMAPDFDALARIIDQFLAFTQGEAGVSAGQPARLAALLQQVHQRYAERGCDLQLVLTQAVPAAPAAAAWPEAWLPDLAVQRMLSNLIDNAFAHGQGPVRLEAEIHPEHCELKVCDQGPGLSAEAFAAARQPFVQLPTSRRGERARGHCGLGLAIVDQLAQQLGGQLVHQPPTQGGCVIGVRLPFMRL